MHYLGGAAAKQEQQRKPFSHFQCFQFWFPPFLFLILIFNSHSKNVKLPIGGLTIQGFVSLLGGGVSHTPVESNLERKFAHCPKERFVKKIGPWISVPLLGHAPLVTFG